MLKYLDNLDKTKPSLNKLAMLPGFNILETPNSIFKEPLTYSNEIGYKNTITLDKTTINEQIFFKLYGLIDTAKKQLTKKSRKKAQRKQTRKQ
jgi:hypothetical protein